MSRAVHGVGKWSASGIGNIPAIYCPAYTGDTQAPTDVTYTGLQEVSEPFAMTAEAASDPSAIPDFFYPLALTQQQWHEFNWRVQYIEVVGAPVLDNTYERHHVKYFTSTGNEAAFPSDEKRLLYFPCGMVHDTSASPDSLIFGVGFVINDTLPITDVLPFEETWPVKMYDYITHSPTLNIAGGISLYRQSIGAVIYYNGMVYPFILFEISSSNFPGFGGQPALLTTNFFRPTPATGDVIDTGFELVLPWGSIPLWIQRTDISALAGHNITSDITVSFFRYFTYSGVWRATTGEQLLSPTPTSM